MKNLPVSLVALGLAGCFGSGEGTVSSAPADSGDAGTTVAVEPAEPEPTPSVCTSGTNWTGGDRGNEKMHPGGACITCHDTQDDAPSFAVAGTVYPTAHEPIDCNGAKAATVIITDAKGKAYSLVTNAAGNFFLKASKTFATPYRAKIVVDGNEREMTAEQTNGDCNSCHTEAGANEAPGRIQLP